MSTTVWIIVAGAVLTYLARAGGHLVLSRFERIHPRVEAALDAVPAAVLTTLVAPAAFQAVEAPDAILHGLPEIAALILAVLLSFRLGILTTFIIASAALVALRHLLG